MWSNTYAVHHHSGPVLFAVWNYRRMTEVWVVTGVSCGCTFHVQTSREHRPRKSGFVVPVGSRRVRSPSYYRAWQLIDVVYLFSHYVHYYTNIDWCWGQPWKIMPGGCVMLLEGRKPECNSTQLRGISFHGSSRLTVTVLLHDEIK